MYPHANVFAKGTLAFIFTEGKFVKRTMSHETCLFTNLNCVLVLTFALKIQNSRGYFLDISKIALFHCCGLNKDGLIELIRLHRPFSQALPSIIVLAFTICRSDNCFIAISFLFFLVFYHKRRVSHCNRINLARDFNRKKRKNNLP